jgi:hypothetical protein
MPTAVCVDDVAGQARARCDLRLGGSGAGARPASGACRSGLCWCGGPVRTRAGLAGLGGPVWTGPKIAIVNGLGVPVSTGGPVP